MSSSFGGTASRTGRRTILILGLVATLALSLPALNWLLRSYLAEGAGNLAAVAADGAGLNPAAARADRHVSAAGSLKPRDPTGTPEYLPRPTAAEEQILEKLEKPIDVAFQETPLEGCIDFLKDKTEIQFYIDKFTLTDEGVALDMPITLTLKSCPLKSVLRLLLEQVRLTATPQNDVLVVTTWAKASEMLVTRIYPVRDLYDESENVFPRLAAKPGDAGNAGECVCAPARRRYSDLVVAINTAIEPASWDSLSGPGSMVYVKNAGSLVIRQTPALHREILQLLRDLREAK